MVKDTAIKLFTVSHALSGKVDDRLDACLEEQTNLLRRLSRREEGRILTRKQPPRLHPPGMKDAVVRPPRCATHRTAPQSRGTTDARCRSSPTERPAPHAPRPPATARYRTTPVQPTNPGTRGRDDGVRIAGAVDGATERCEPSVPRQSPPSAVGAVEAATTRPRPNASSPAYQRQPRNPRP